MILSERIKIRPPEKTDIDFIIDGVIEAEKGGRQIIPTQVIFNISLDEFRFNLRSFLENDEVVDCEYSLNTYLIAEIDGIPVASLSCWLESLNGLGSNLVKLNCWLTSLESEKIQSILPLITQANKYSITRLNNFLQLEYLYVLPQYRKKGLLKELIRTGITNTLKLNKEFLGCQTILFMENLPSYNFFNKRGFELNQKIKIMDDALNFIFEHNTRVSLILKKENIDSFLKVL